MVEKDGFEQFQQQLQVCLTHFYDYTFLFNHPWLSQLIPEDTGADRVQQFRDKVTQAIEKLRPATNMPFHSKDARAYNVLHLRYLDQQDTEAVMQYLALSRRQYFREHARALEFLARLFLQQSDHQDPLTPAIALAKPSITLETEIASLGQANEHTRLEAGALLQSVLEATARLGVQHGVHLFVAPDLPPVEFIADRTMIRQVLLSIFSNVIIHLSAGSEIRCQYSATENSVLLTLWINDLQGAVKIGDLQQQITAIAPLEQMLYATGTIISVDQLPDQAIQIVMGLPRKPYNLLLIDDNPDVIDLFRRYLTHSLYSVTGVQDGKTAIQIARQRLHHVIILDLMLPHQDGYEILQNLKNHPLTADIPVLICSVVETPALALSLGADHYLKKPPGQQELLTILANLLH